MIAFGNVPANSVLPIYFGSYNSSGASVALTGLLTSDIEIYKNSSIVQRASDNGYVLIDTDGIDTDGITGINGFTIDLSDNSDAGFYSVGSFYTVIVSAVTIDSQTVNFVAASFRIVAAEIAAGYPAVSTDKVDGVTINPPVNGRFDAQVGAIADGVITFAKFAQSYWDAFATYVWGQSVGALAGVSDSFGGAIADLWSRVDVNVSTRSSQTSQDTISSNVTNIQSRLPAALVGGRMDASVGVMQADVLTAAATAADFSTEINTGQATAAAQASIAEGVASILTRLPTNLIGGRMDSHVGSVADGAFTFAKFSGNFFVAISDYVWSASVGVYAGVSDSFGEYLNSIRNELENVAGEVWDVQLSAHLQTGSTGAALNAAGAAGDPWSTALPGAYGAGTAGFIVGTNLDALVSSRLAAASYTAPDNTTIATINVVVASLSARIPASLVGGRMDSHVGSVADGVLTFPKFSSGYWEGVSAYVWAVSVGQFAGISDSFGSYVNDMRNEIENLPGEVWDVTLTAHLQTGSTGAALNAAGAAGDPWATALPGAYGAGTAGNILGNRLDVAVSSRLASASYTAPDNSSIAAIGVIVTSISARIPAALINGRMDAYVGDAAPGALTFDKFGQSFWDGITTYVWSMSVGQYAGISDSFAHATAEIWSRAGAYLDVAISTRLATSGYTAPDNSSIATIASRVDVATSTRLAGASYTAPDNASITSIKAKTDQLSFTVANMLDANIQYVNDVQVNGVGTVGNPWGP